MLYASSSLALACLEVLVHIRDVYNIPQFSYCAIDVAADLISPWNEKVQETRRAQAILESTVLSQEFGDQFLAGRIAVDVDLPTRLRRLGGWLRSAQLRRPCSADAPVQAVPSIVAPDEWNYLLNPNHKQFGWLQWSVPREFRFDPRLLDTALR
jgi:RES domain-containing protein